jgi:hypothetical protein
MIPTNPTALTLRAFVAYCESGDNPTNPFTLIPHADAIAAGIPFAQTFIHEGREWAVFVTGDFMPDELCALEDAGVVDPYDFEADV